MNYIVDFLDYLRVRRRYSAYTERVYGEAIRRFIEYMGKQTPATKAENLPGEELLRMLTPQNIRGFIASQLDKKMSAESVNLALSGLSSFCTYLVKQNALTVNPVKAINRPKEKKRLPSFYTQKAMEDYLQTPVAEGFAALRDRTVINLIYSTGMRRAEVASLRLSDYDKDRGVFKITGKGNKQREIPVTEQLAEAISVYLTARYEFLQNKSHQDEDYFFLTDSGQKLYLAFLNKVVHRELGAQKGFSGKKSPHILRHTFATALLNNGADLNSIKEVLGHSSLAATQIYTHNSFAQLAKVYKSAHPRAKKEV